MYIYLQVCMYPFEVQCHIKCYVEKDHKATVYTFTFAKRLQVGRQSLEVLVVAAGE